MPCSNASNLSQTLVSLPWQLLGVPSRGDTLESLALGNTNDINHFVLGEDIFHRNGLLKMVPCPCNLVSDRSTVELDLHEMSLLLTLVHQLHLQKDGNINDTR